MSSHEISRMWIGFLGICLISNAPGFSFNLYGLPQNRDRKHMLLCMPVFSSVINFYHVEIVFHPCLKNT